MNRSSLTRLPQIGFAVLALIALLIAQFGTLFASAPPTATMPLTVASLDGQLAWTGTLFAYPLPPPAPTSDPFSHNFECTAQFPQACARLALRDSGDARVRDLLALMLTDYGPTKLEQANLVLGYSDEELANILNNLRIFTSGVLPGPGTDNGSRAVRGQFISNSILDIALYLRLTDPTRRAALLNDARERMLLVLGTNPTDPDYRYNMGMVELIAGNAQMAVEHLEFGNRIAPRNPRIVFALVAAYIATGKAQLAQNLARLLYQPSSSYPELEEAYADAAMMSGDAAAAMNAYDQALRNQAYLDWGLYQQYLGATISTGRYRQALATIDLLLTNQPNEPKLYADRAGLYALLGNRAAADADYTKAASFSGISESNRLALTLARDAVDGTNKLPANASLGPSDFGNAITRQLSGKTDEAASLYQQVLRSNISNDVKAAALANLAAIYIGKKQYDQATALFSSGPYDLSQPPAAGAAFYPYLNAAYAYDQARQADKADIAYARALEAVNSAVTNAAAISNTGYISSTASLPMIPAAQRGLTHRLWADSLAARGQSDLATYHYRESLNAWPLGYSTWYQLARLYQQQGKAELAEAALLKTLAINPDYAAATQALTALYYQRGYLSGGEFAASVQGKAALGATSTAALDGYLPAIGGGLPSNAGTLLDRRPLVVTLLLILMAVASFLPTASRLTLKTPLGWLLATLVMVIMALLVGPLGVASLSLLGLFAPQVGFVSFSSPLQIGFYLFVALLTAVLLYGAGSWLQRQIAHQQGIEAQHDFSLLGLAANAVSLLLGGFIFGPLLHLRIATPVATRPVAVTDDKGRTRLAGVRDVEVEEELTAADLAQPYLYGLGFAALVTLVFLVAYLLSGLPSLRLAAVVAAAYFASQAVSGLGALGEGLANWRGWLWLPFAVVAAGLYGTLLVGWI